MTPGQRRVWDFIKSYNEENGYGPSYREIMRALGISSTNIVHWFVNALADQKAIEYRPGKRRSLVALPIAGLVPVEKGRMNGGVKHTIEPVAGFEQIQEAWHQDVKDIAKGD